MGFTMMNTLSQLPLFFLGLFLAAEAQPQRGVHILDLGMSSTSMEILRMRLIAALAQRRLSPKNAEKLYKPQIVQRLTPKNAEKIYNPEAVQKLSPKNAEKLYNPEIVQRLTP